MTQTYFTDRDLGKQFPRILAAAGLAVERHTDHFADACADEEWLREVGRRGWVAITHDARIRYKPNELATVMANAVPLLVLIGNAKTSELARNFVNTASKIATYLNQASPPFIAKVYRASPAELGRNPNHPGRIEHWHP